MADNTINPSNGARTTASDVLQFVYDSRDQLQLERAVNPLVAVSTVLDHDYDLNGRATALATNLGGTISGSNITGGVKDLTNQYAWDALGRLTSVTQTSQYGGNSVAAKLATFQYDAASELTDLRRYSSTSASSMYLEVHSRLGYDGAGRLQSLTHAKSEIASGQMWNGTSTLPTSLQGGKLLAGYFLAYDQDNRLTGWSSYADAFKTTFAYDTRDQVTGATHTAIAGLTLPRAMPASENYAFDGTGNRNLSGGSSSSANGTFNRVQNDGTYTYDFDAEGNQIRRTKIADGKVTEYEYDYRNRLVKVTEKNSLAGAATKVVTYQYDAFDRRTGKQLDADANGTVDRKTAWVWDGQQVIMQLVDADGAGAGAWKLTNRYLYGDAVDLLLADEQLPSGGIGLTSVSYTTGNVLWPLFDQLGSVRDVVDSNGVIRQHLVFDSFGNRLSETDYNTSGVVIPNNDPAAVDELFGYTGREWDSDVKLQYNRARWYDPAQGRWISQDPIGFGAGDVNLYRYVGNGATGATDPSGLETRVEWQDIVLKKIGVTRDQLEGYNRFDASNRAIMRSIYGYYETVFEKNPDLLWAGMAKLAGRAVWTGCKDIQKYGFLASASGHALRLANEIERQLLQMNLDVFMDMAWQHEAFLTKGYAELEARHQAGELSKENLEAWYYIAKGIESDIQGAVNLGNEMLLLREQRRILDRGYRVLSGLNIGMIMGAMSKSPVPGGRSFSQAVPGGDLQGQRTLSAFSCKDLQQVIKAPTGLATLHDIAFFARMLLDQA